MAREHGSHSFEEMNSLEQKRQRQMGFTRGFSVGEETGWRDGYIFGVKKGAQLSAEIGYYQGFSHAWIAILEREDSSKQRKLSGLYALLEMTRGFPQTNNLLEHDALQKLARIRAKFKQVNALILGHVSVGAGTTTMPAQTGAYAAGVARRKSAVPPPPQQPPAPACGAPINNTGGSSLLRQRSGLGCRRAAHPQQHGDMLMRGASWTSQDSTASTLKRAISPARKTEMSF